MANKAGFEKPVGAVVRLRLNRLRSALKQYSPQGRPRQKGFTVNGKRYTYKTDYTPGKLKKSWDDPNTVRLAPSGKTIIIDNPLPYARAQDKGANIPTRYPKKPGGFLMFRFHGKIFHKQARGFKLKGQNFVKKAVDSWKSQFDDAPNVRWAPYRGVRVEE